MRVIGVDACKGGWVGIELDGGRFAGARFAASLERLLDASPRPAVVAVDMPLGLLERGWRRADLEAPAWLGRRRSSVFRVAPRAVWAEDEFDAANELCRVLTGQGLSRQAWGLAGKLREANQLLDRGEHRMYEVHPEVSFRAMARLPLAHSKTTRAGRAQRRELLADAGIGLPAELGEASSVPPVDVLDAAAAAWSARRIGSGAAASFPDPPELDAAGRPIAIYY
jgi:predicted RNase H-like nuclease